MVIRVCQTHFEWRLFNFVQLRGEQVHFDVSLISFQNKTILSGKRIFFFLTTNDQNWGSMKKHTLRWCQTPPSVTVRTKPNNAYSLQIKRSLRLKRPNGPDAQGPAGKSQPSQCQHELYRAKVISGPTLVVQRQEMAAFFRIFGEWLFYYKEQVLFFNTLNAPFILVI